jgi:hypothetical protein
LARAVALQIATLLPNAVKQPTGAVPKQGDPALLVLNMSEAAARYGVVADVVPRRRRVAEAAYA